MLITFYCQHLFESSHSGLLNDIMMYYSLCIPALLIKYLSFQKNLKQYKVTTMKTIIPKNIIPKTVNIFDNLWDFGHLFKMYLGFLSIT